MNRKQRQRLAIGIAVGLAVLVAFFLLLQPSATQAGVQAQTTLQGNAETPYGEYLRINLGTSAQTSQAASWVAAVATTSQNVWTVNSTYKSQGQITLGYTLSVSYSNVQNIQIVSLYIKAVDVADSSSYQYVLASGKSLSGSSPISDSGSTTKTISQHLTDVVASQPCTVKYYIYCKVQGQGTVSGQTLVAEVTETWFCTLNYAQQTESTTATVTPSVTVASWMDALTPYNLGLIAVVGVAAGVVLAYIAEAKHAKRGRRR